MVTLVVWLVVGSVLTGLAGLALPTEQDLRQAGVYLGQKRE